MYRIPYAIPQLIRLPQAQILRQSTSGYDYMMELYTHEIKENTFTIDSLVEKPVVVFCYALKGQVSSQYLSGGQSVNLLAEQYAAFYLPAGIYKLTLQKGSHVFFCFRLKKEYFCWLSEEYTELNPLVNYLTTSVETRKTLPVCRVDFGVKRIIKRLQTCNQKGEVQNAARLSLILELLDIYQEQLESGNYKLYKTAKEIAYEIKEHLEQNYTKAGTYHISDLALHFNISERTLVREFKNITGTTIRQYIITLRMGRALQLLKEGNKPIKDIAAATGYSDVYSFSKAFKKFYDYPPGEVRRVHSEQ